LRRAIRWDLLPIMTSKLSYHRWGVVLLGLVAGAVKALGCGGVPEGSIYHGEFIQSCEDDGPCGLVPEARCVGMLCACPTQGDAICLGGPTGDQWVCRPRFECHDPEPAGATGGSGGASTSTTIPTASSSGVGGGGTGGTGDQGGSGGESGGPNVPGPECETAADCTEKPADARCGGVECINGECQLIFKSIEKIDSQIRGDCVSTYCDGQGATIILPDHDEYNDGKECTFDTCEDLMVENIPLPDGSPCPETGAGVCFDGECVECIDGVADICGNGFGCEGLICVPTTCLQMKNGMVDPPLEAGVDCGGQCYPCFYPQTCNAGTDCAHGVCSGGMCALPTHSDGIKNDNETGIDCGCVNCAPCPDDYECETWENCQSLVCWGGKCQAPKCNDGRQNGDEAGLDCGGACNTSCP